ncbi:hypothetical protein [Cytobacillus purgationiresistens]|uniref:Group-specific protein n=1 Tax=Cytobacillus purgationiresistens TaxID=863449 RepID=A0ABU0ABV5_9BACI|nr:hypothetical protein [Cytobacillus purgationiresistens]MDQ0268530.1 hypothetical protein [Cytobacillus purgationiresistens]
MIKKSLIAIIILGLFPKIVPAETNQYIEIYDIKKNEVIMKVPSDINLQKEVKKFLVGITGVNSKFRPIPNKGFMIKIPLEPVVNVENQWLNDLVVEVIIIFPEQDAPCLMVFDDKNKVHFFTFKSDTEEFLSLLNFRP